MNKTFRSSFTPIIMNELQTGRIETVDELWDRLRAQYPKLDFDSFRIELRELMGGGYVEIVEPVFADFAGYLKSWRYGVRAWALLVLTLVTLSVVELLQAPFPLAVIRWTAATFLLLYAPGFAIVWVLFPSRQRMSGLNRLALTIAMSLFTVPAVGLLFNYTPVGIEAQPIAAVIAALTVLSLFFGAYREFLLHKSG